MTRLLFFGALAVALGAAAASPASGGFVLTIDDYTQPGGNPNFTQTKKGTKSVTQSGLPTANVIGGERENVLKVTTSQFGLSTTVNFLSGPGLLAVSNQVGNASTLTQTYDGPGSAGLGGIDLTANNGAFFEFGVVSTDLGVSATITVKDTLGKTSTLTQSVLGPGSLIYDFADFTGTADFTKTKSIRVAFNAPKDADYAVDFLGVGAPVPEPASVGLASTGLIASGLVRRRFRKAAV
ncbi:MAG: PEP-CTERM sorting domain-containing protein [Gemmataceae bacterium]|nr:PEP-CTERM sorting domain-containing protein [Gemmataceae bacterium]